VNPNGSYGVSSGERGIEVGENNPKQKVGVGGGGGGGGGVGWGEKKKKKKQKKKKKNRGVFSGRNLSPNKRLKENGRGTLRLLRARVNNTPSKGEKNHASLEKNSLSRQNPRGG